MYHYLYRERQRTGAADCQLHGDGFSISLSRTPAITFIPICSWSPAFLSVGEGRPEARKIPVSSVSQAKRKKEKPFKNQLQRPSLSCCIPDAMTNTGRKAGS